MLIIIVFDPKNIEFGVWSNLRIPELKLLKEISTIQ